MTEPGHYHDVLKDLSAQHRALRQDIPDVYKAFNELSNAALTDGALPTRIKELMAMAMGVVHGCDGCIASHARGAARAGASAKEAAEAIGVARTVARPSEIPVARTNDFMLTHFFLRRSVSHLCISTLTPKSDAGILVSLGAGRQELEGHDGADDHNSG